MEQFIMAAEKWIRGESNANLRIYQLAVEKKAKENRHSV